MRLNSKWKKVLLVLAVVPLSACSLGQLKGSSGNSSTKGNEDTSKVGSAFSPSSDARKDVSDALRRLNTAYPYRLTETTKATANGQTGPESTRVVEFAAADRSHMKWTGGAGGDVEAISIGEKHYWFADGKWTEGTVPSSKGVNRSEDFTKKLAEMVKEVRYLGPETINGVPCFAYSFTVETNLGGHDYTGTGKAWIGADGLPYQSDSDFKVATYAHKSHIVYEYNVDVKVERPAL